jgi:hypothetical protein
MYLHPVLINDLAAAQREDALRRAAGRQPKLRKALVPGRRLDRSRAAPRLRLRFSRPYS